MFKLGDKSYKKYEQEVENDMAKEEIQISKIRDLIKDRNNQPAKPGYQPARVCHHQPK